MLTRHSSRTQDVEEARGAAEALATTAELMLDEAPHPEALGSEAGNLIAQLAKATEALVSATTSEAGALQSTS